MPCDVIAMGRPAKDSQRELAHPCRNEHGYPLSRLTRLEGKRKLIEGNELLRST